MAAAERKACKSGNAPVFVLYAQHIVVAGFRERPDERTPVQLSAPRNAILPPPVADDALPAEHPRADLAILDVGIIPFPRKLSDGVFRRHYHHPQPV